MKWRIEFNYTINNNTTYFSFIGRDSITKSYIHGFCKHFIVIVILKTEILLSLDTSHDVLKYNKKLFKTGPDHG